jgi:uncharacterized protein (DUF1330 family)
MKTRYAIALAGISAIAGAGLVQTIHAQSTPKANVVAEIEVTDAAKFKPYLDGTAVIVPEAGGRFLARGNKTFTLAGAPPNQSFFASDSYKKLIPSREAGSNFRAFIVEGR